MTVGVVVADVGKGNIAVIGRLPICYVNKVGSPRLTFQDFWEISATMKVLHQGCYLSLGFSRVLVICRCCLSLTPVHNHVPAENLLDILRDHLYMKIMKD